MRNEIWFDLERREAVIPWREYSLTARRIAGAALAFVLLIGATAVVDGRELAPTFIAAAPVAAFALLSFVVLNYLLIAGPFRTAIGISPKAMAAPTWFRPHYVEWPEVRALICIHSLLGSLAPIDRNLIVVTKDHRKTRLFLPVISNTEMTQLVTILRDIADENGFELILDNTEEGRKRARQLGA